MMSKNDYEDLVQKVTSEVFSLSGYDIKDSKEFFALALVTRRFIDEQLSGFDESINNNAQKLQTVYDAVITQLKELVKSIAEQIRREETTFLDKERELLRPFLDEQKSEFTEFLYITMKDIIRKLKTEGGLDLSKEIAQSAEVLTESANHLQAKAEKFQEGVRKAAFLIAMSGLFGAITGSLLTLFLLTIFINLGIISIPL
ncbi:TPA: hypothetical protein ACF3I9_004431 [Klebsiella aerogenes]